MKKFLLPLFFLLVTCSLSGCGLIEDSFKAGLFIGLFVIGVIALLVWILRIAVNRLVRKGIISFD